MRGYKIASLRSMYGVTGIIEEMRFGTASINDLKVSEDILMNSSCFHDGDILLMDRDFWKLEDFKSTKLNVIAFHLIGVLFGYLFYQLYLNTEDGEKYIGKGFPIILKNYKEEFLQYLVLHSGEYFCSMTMREFIEYRDSCSR